MIFGAAAKRYAATFRGKTFDSSSDVEGYLTNLFSSAMKEAADGQTARIEALEAENARLKEALRAIKSPHLNPPHGDEPDGRLVNFYAQWVMQCQDTARAALGEKP